MSVQTGSSAIRPFTIEVPEAELETLRTRVAASRWPDKETVPDHSQGVQLATIQELARYWVQDHDWRACEAKLNALPQFMTEIDGLDIHFIHVRSDHDNALPLILTHGWPGSVIELLKVIDPLTNPTAHGGSASDAFHVVIQSMPGYGYSDKPQAAGWGPDHIATSWVQLMKRLGYDKFVAQGGPPPVGYSSDEKRAFEQMSTFYTKGAGYGVEMGTQPQTLYGVADSPVGLAAWIINHDAYSYGEI